MASAPLPALFCRLPGCGATSSHKTTTKTQTTEIVPVASTGSRTSQANARGTAMQPRISGQNYSIHPSLAQEAPTPRTLDCPVPTAILFGSTATTSPSPAPRHPDLQANGSRDARRLSLTCHRRPGRLGARPQKALQQEHKWAAMENSSDLKRSAAEEPAAEQSAVPSHASPEARPEALRLQHVDGATATEQLQGSPAKRPKLDAQGDGHGQPNGHVQQERRAGTAAIKAEFLITTAGQRDGEGAADDDEAEKGHRGGSKGKGKAKGQNTQRNFGSSRDAFQLCMSRAMTPEFSPAPCRFGEACKYEHDLRKYLREGKREDLQTFGGACPIWEARGSCSAGWRCRFASSHSKELTRQDGRTELVLFEPDLKERSPASQDVPGEDGLGVVNVVPAEQKIDLRKRKIGTPKADAYTDYLNKSAADSDARKRPEAPSTNGIAATNTDPEKTSVEENRARYNEPPFLPSEKRRLYYGPETPILAPLTTQGNLPFRRLCVELGAQITWSEMAMGQPLIQGEKSEWALMKAHESEMASPKCSSKGVVLEGYDNAGDFRFGAQIAANKPWLALKTTEVLTALCPSLRAIDLNCGCPIDLVFRQGAGSALLDRPAQLEKIIRGMNAVSGEVPISAKIRMGTRDDKPTAQKLIERLTFGGHEAYEMNQGPPGLAALTLHGRSRQQRYTKSADWNYISECAALIEEYNEEKHGRLDTTMEADPRSLSPHKDGKMYFIGNGDCYSHIDYYEHIEKARVDTVMVARGALIKPWIFEEIEKRQYLDKSASERLRYVEKYARYGLENWGSDEIGVGTTRRFLLEWLSFACRYVPIGLLEHLPPRIQDRPPAYRGRDDLESLMASDNYKDWIKISEWFLGPAHKDFRFEPKHKSNSYDEAEG